MNMPRYVVRHGHGFAFRIVVPSRLRILVGQTVIKRTLRTRDPCVAQAWALVLAHRYARAFHAIARADMPKSADDLLASALGALESGQAQEYKITQRRGVFGVETDGTELDHKQAMDMLALMQSKAPVASDPMPSQAQMQAVAPIGLKRISLKKAIEEYKARIKPPLSDTSKTKTFNGPISKALAELSDYAGENAYVFNITRNDISKLATLMLSKVAKSTVRDKLSYITGFFDFAITAQYYPAGGLNPAVKHITITSRDKRASSKRGWKAFSVEQLKQIFGSEAFYSLKDRDTQWLALLALYTGARSKELAQIDLIDCETIMGQPCISITDEGEDMSVKNAHSKRTIPIHPDLVKLGFWEMVEKMQGQGERALFPKGNRKALNGPSAQMSKKFSAYLKELKIEARGEGIIGLRSFRPTVITQLAESGVSQGWRELFVGHEQSDAMNTQTTSHAMSYTQLNKVQLVSTLASQCLPPLTWSSTVLDVDVLRLILK
jgi:integrase